MREEKTTVDRLAAFSDAVFAVIVTIQCRVSAVFVGIVFSPSPPASVRFCAIKVNRRLAHSKERATREEKTTADRLAAFSDAVNAPSWYWS